jgi:hypothetical protein
LDRVAAFLQLVVDAGVVAPKSPGADYGDCEWLLWRWRGHGFAILSDSEESKKSEVRMKSRRGKADSSLRSE